MNNDTLPQIYLKWKFLCPYFCQNWQYFCNSDIGIIFGHQKGVDCAFFGVFSELLGGTAKFWGSKNENIAFFRDRLVPILPFTPKDFISAISDLPGHFRWCQNWFTKFTKIGGLCVSTTVVTNQLLMCHNPKLGLYHILIF